MAQDSRIAALYDLWYQERDEIFKTYSGNPSERLPLSQNPEFKPVRNAVVKAALGIEHQEEVIEERPDSNEPGYFSREYGGNKSWWTDEYKLARKYLYGSEDASPDPVRAMELLQREAEKGNGFALYDLGLMARNGFGFAKDDVLAQEQFRKALAAFMAEESRTTGSTASAKCMLRAMALSRISERQRSGMRKQRRRATPSPHMLSAVCTAEARGWSEMRRARLLTFKLLPPKGTSTPSGCWTLCTQSPVLRAGLLRTPLSALCGRRRGSFKTGSVTWTMNICTIQIAS
jgi:hypothetical protein